MIGLICAKCRLLCEGCCPLCGSARHLREPEPNEPVHLITLSAAQALLVEPILLASGVPYFKKGSVGGGLTAQVGIMREMFRFYVPASARERCVKDIEKIFGEDAQLMALLHEFDRGGIDKTQGE